MVMNFNVVNLVNREIKILVAKTRYTVSVYLCTNEQLSFSISVFVLRVATVQRFQFAIESFKPF